MQILLGRFAHIQAWLDKHLALRGSVLMNLAQDQVGQLLADLPEGLLDGGNRWRSDPVQQDPVKADHAKVSRNAGLAGFQPLRTLDVFGDDGAFDTFTLLKTKSVHHPGYALAGKQTHQFVFKTHIEHRTTRVALTTGTIGLTYKLK